VNLSAKDLGIAKAVLRGELEQLFVRHAAPQEIRKARGELEIGEGSGRLDAEQEARRNENGFDSELHTLIDGLGLLHKAHQAVDFVASHWTSIRPASQIGKIGAGAGERMVAGGVTTAEDAAVAF
jgi:hypothetical protein